MGSRAGREGDVRSLRRAQGCVRTLHRSSSPCHQLPKGTAGCYVPRVPRHPVNVKEERSLWNLGGGVCGGDLRNPGTCVRKCER